MESENEEEKSVKQQRSPNFPVIGIRQAIAKLQMIYKEDKLAGSSRMTALKHMGFSGPSGSSLTVLSALKKFELIKEQGDRIVITENGKNLLLLPESDSRRVEVLKKSALSPELYKNLYERYKSTGLPSNETLRADLIFDFKCNEKAAQNIVSNFKDTIEFADVVLGGDQSEKPTEEIEKEEIDNSKNSHQIKNFLEAKNDSIKSYVIPRKDDKFACLQLESPVSEMDIEIIQKWLEVLKFTIIDK